MTSSDSDVAPPAADRQRRRRSALLASVFVIGACGLLYELVAGAVASYLMGDAVAQYSLVIGVFLAAMGVGAYLTRWMGRHLLETFLYLQILIGVIGGVSSLALFAAFGYAGNITPHVLGFSSVCGALVGMEIPLVLRILRGEGSLRVNISQVLALDYFGALAASIAFPFLILPRLGLVRAALAVGSLNLLVAALGWMLFRGELHRPNRLLAALLAAGGLLGLGWIISPRATTWFEDMLYQDEIIYAETTPYQRIVITRWRHDIRLHLDGHLQFSSADEYRYHEPLTLPALGWTPEPKRALVLGGGDGLAARELLRHPQLQHLDLVDIDPRVVRLFRQSPLLRRLNANSLDDPRLRYHAEDAFAYLRNRRDLRYDVIVMDLPDPSDARLNKLYTDVFYGLALRNLNEQGVLVTQATSPFYARKAFWCIAHTVQAAADTHQKAGGPRRRIVPYHVHVPSFGDWGFVLAVPAATQSNGRLPWDGRFLTEETFAAACHFPPDSRPLTTGVNRIDDPLLIQYHKQGWASWNE